MLMVARRNASLEIPEEFYELEPRIPRGDHPLGPWPFAWLGAMLTPLRVREHAHGGGGRDGRGRETAAW